MNRPRAVKGSEGQLLRVLPSAIALDAQTMEVLGWVGFALIWAQGLERTLAAYLSFARPDCITATTNTFRRFVRQAQRKTSGDLITALQRCDLDADETAMLAWLKTLGARRDRLAHHFLRQPSDRDLLRTPAGRARLIRQARNDADDFRIAMNRVALFAIEHAIRLSESTDLLRDHSDWLIAVKADVARRGGRQAFDPTLATEIGELLEAIEHPRT